jgi:ABC-type phosphate transport system substrate-binding protein
MATKDRRFDRRVCLVSGSGVVLSSLLDATSAIATPSPELLVVVHPSNSIRLSVEELASIFKTTMRYWSGSKRIVALNLPPRSPERVTFDRVVLGMDPDASFRFWIDRKIRGGEPAPRNVPDPDVVLGIVQRTEAAIGYAPSHLVKDGVRVIARIRGNSAENVAVSGVQGAHP